MRTFIPSARPAIVALHCVGGPTAVTRKVSERIIDAIKGMFDRRTLAHIGEKSRKRIAPAFAYGYSASAIIGIALIFGVFAASNHGAPAGIFHQRLTVAPSAVFEWSGLGQASATLWHSTTQIVGVDESHITADTSTHPSRLPGHSIWPALDDGKSMKYLPGQVNNCSHNIDLIT